MSIKLGTIVVDFLANTAGFQSGLTKASYAAKKEAKEIHSSFQEMSKKIGESFGEVLNSLGPVGGAFAQFGNAVNEVGGALAGGGSAIAGAAIALGAVGAAAIAGAAGLAELAISGAEVVERLSNISQKTGVSIRDLQVFEAAGQSVGVSLEDMVVGMRKFDQALTGVGKNAAAGAILKELGVTAKNNKDALIQTADAFQKMADGPEKAALAVQLFGKSGLQMIPFLNKGADGIREFEELVDKFGPKIGKDAVKANEDYKKSVAQLGLEWDNFKVTIEKNVLPILTKLGSIDLSEQWASFAGFFKGGTAGALKAVQDLNAERAKGTEQAHKEADAEAAKQAATQKQVDSQEAIYDKAKAGGEAAYALEQARSKMTAEIAVHNFEAATNILNQIPGLEKAAAEEAKRVAHAKQIAESYAKVSAILNSGNFSKPFHKGGKPFDSTKGTEALFGPQEKNPNEGAPDLGLPKSLTDAASIPELGKTLQVGQDYIKDFNDRWKAQAQGTADSINADYNSQLAQLQGFLALGEISETQAKDVFLKIQQERFDGLKRLREQNGETTFGDAWANMFTKIQASGKNFSASLVDDIGGAIEQINTQLVNFVATGKGLDMKKIGQSMTASLTSSVLKKGESSLLGMFGLGDNNKPDGSTQQNALWVQFAGPGSGFTAGLGALPLPNLGNLLNFGGGSSADSSGLTSLASNVGNGLSNFGSSMGSFFSSFGGFLADGGPVTPGKSYVVGEERPELFMPRSAGTIVPSVSGNNTVNSNTVHMHISTPDADSFRKSQSQISSAMGNAVARG
jgi:hypothetical protein